MKKALLTIVTALLVLSLNAQISVWDGTAEPWTHGSGTPSDPILIENAEQLAYLSQNGHQLDCQYYKLMNDIDLDNRDWLPIGYYSSATSTVFNGYFDGNGHTVYHLTTTLFWWMDEGYIKNLTIKDSEMVLQYGLNCFGGMVNYAPLIENCYNYGDVVLDYDEGNNIILSWSMGGIVGDCTTIENCSNHGKLKVIAKSPLGVLTIGGVAGTAVNMEQSCNTGGFVIDSDVSECIAGGVCGVIVGEISNCYNTVNLLVGCDNSFVGGITGGARYGDKDTVNINSCYNAGNLNASNIGGIIAEVITGVTVNVDNCYYIDTIASTNDYGSPKSEADMKTQDFVDLLNTAGDVYAMDDMHVNQGYPIFAQYYSVDEKDAYNGISVYPNPARNIVHIAFSDDAACAQVDVYSLDGSLLKSQISDFERVDMSGLEPGIYIIKVRLADGREFAERIVRE